MDFEKIVDTLPIGITIWRLESDIRVGDSSDFRLVYANNQANIESNTDLFEYVGRMISSIPQSSLYPSCPDIWIRALISNKEEKFNKSKFNKLFDIQIIPLRNKCVAVIFRDITAEEQVKSKTSRSLSNLKKVEYEFSEYKKTRNSDRASSRSLSPDSDKKTI